MKNFHTLQRRKHGSPVVPSTSLDQQKSSFEPTPGHQSITLSGDLQTDLQQATRSGRSFGDIAITRNDLEPEHRYAVNPPEIQRPVAPSEHVMQRKPNEPAVSKGNATGLPDNLKTEIENLSGVSLDDVHVHYNSSKPAEVAALAYTQGSEIHVGPGQEQHLAHEAWHVVQQKQGRVQPTMQMKGVSINDDEGLEREADVMGERANIVQRRTSQEGSTAIEAENEGLSKQMTPVTQRVKGKKGGKGGKAEVEEGTEESGGPAESLELVKATVGQTEITVYVDAHQNKHQATQIGQLKPYTGGAGSKFPAKVDLNYHRSTLAIMVMEWAKKNIGKIKGSKNRRLAAGKYDLSDIIDFEVMAVYEEDGSISVTYHCNPNDKAKAKDF